MTFQDYLNENFACVQAREWAAGKTAAQAWNECERADWLMWWVNQEKNGPDYTDKQIRQVWFLLKSMVRMIPMPTEVAGEYCKLIDIRLNIDLLPPQASCNSLYISLPSSPKSFCLNYLLDTIYQKNPSGHYVVGVLSNFQLIKEVSDSAKAELAQIVREGFTQPWKEDSENV